MSLTVKRMFVVSAGAEYEGFQRVAPARTLLTVITKNPSTRAHQLNPTDSLPLSALLNPPQSMSGLIESVTHLVA
jgi:hypothetical protein